MIFNIDVNNRTIKARRGETILSALQRNGINVPTLCHMKDYSPTGACRMCVVEVEGQEDLITSCSHPVEEWMKIKTHSMKVIEARKTIIELLLANHPDDCLYCIRNRNCELQTLAESHNVRDRKFSGHKNKQHIDLSSSSIVSDMSKCVLCSRCIRVCDEMMKVSALNFIGRGNKTIVGTTLNQEINVSSCITCGQCILVCPTAALHEKDNFTGIFESFHSQNKHIIFQCSPTTMVSICEEFGQRPGKNYQSAITSAMHRIGFNRVFDISFAVDVMIMELTRLLQDRLNSGINKPLFSSDCPAWVKYIEQTYPEMIPDLAPVKSPQQIMGSLVKSFYAENYKIPKDHIYIVSGMPCTAKKFEAQREEMIEQGISDIDTVLTTRELAKFIRLNGIEPDMDSSENPDLPFASGSGSGYIAGSSGGITEALIRNMYFQVTGEEMQVSKISKLRTQKGIKEIRVKAGSHEIGFMVVNGLGNLSAAMNEISVKPNEIHFVEVMACPGGCVNGGGQPLRVNEENIKTRCKTLYDFDDKESIKIAVKNPFVHKIYQDYLSEPGSAKSTALLHTVFKPREVLL